MIELPDQPRAERVLRAILRRERPPQQLLFHGPPGTGKRQAAFHTAWALIEPDGQVRADGSHLDLTVVAPSGTTIRLDDLEPALRDLAMRPSVGKRRVVVIDGAERLREQDGAHRILKTLEEPPPLSHIILITDRATDLLPTIRSRCLPVPFRPPHWTVVAERLVARGLDAHDAEGLARGAGPAALRADDFALAMRLAGADLGARLVRGGVPAISAVAEIQERMAAAAAGRSSPELDRLRGEADDLEGKRGEKTARKRADEQERREVRRALTDGWVHVLDGAAELVADGLAIVIGAGEFVRHRDRVEIMRSTLTHADQPFLEHAADDIARTKAELELNPTVDLAMQALIIRIGEAKTGRIGRLRPAGHLPI